MSTRTVTVTIPWPPTQAALAADLGRTIDACVRPLQAELGLSRALHRVARALGIAQGRPGTDAGRRAAGYRRGEYETVDAAEYLTAKVRAAEAAERLGALERARRGVVDWLVGSVPGAAPCAPAGA